jgi:hypothetical protein
MSAKSIVSLRTHQDLTGRRFGHLVVQKYVGGKQYKWECVCDCGGRVIAQAIHLKSELIRSCGCFRAEFEMGNRAIDLAGRRFARLVVVGFAGRTKTKTLLWKCRCDCGSEVAAVRSQSLLRGNTRSCGCYHRERAGEMGRASVKHGDSKSVEYNTYKSMIDRCHKEKNPAYKTYGAKGIRVCQRWRDDYSNFLADMGRRPSNDHSIDRIDNTHGYSCGECEDCLTRGEPKNCRWLLKAKQARNKTTNTFIECGGERLTLAEWAERSGLTCGCITKRMRCGWTAEEAINTPIQREHAKIDRRVPRATARMRKILADLRESSGAEEATRIMREAFAALMAESPG